MGKLNVLVIYGGCSSEHDISILSASYIISNMSVEKYNVIPLYITKDGHWLMYEGTALDNIKNIQWDRFGVNAVLSPDTNHKGLIRLVGDKSRVIPIDVIFPVLHGKNGEDGTIQGLFDISEIPYVGCGVLSSAVSMDKGITKIVAEKVGANQAPYIVIDKVTTEKIEEIGKNLRTKLGYPSFVKPANAGSSVGISKIKNKKEFEKAVELASSFDKKVVIEKGISGREVECAVLGNAGGDVMVSGVGEILPAAEFYDYDAKYNDEESKTIIPAELDKNISEEIRETASKIYNALGCRGLSRVDFFVEAKTNKVIFNEINTLPGFTPISMYPMLWEKEGIKSEELIDKLIELAFEK